MFSDLMNSNSVRSFSTGRRLGKAPYYRNASLAARDGSLNILIVAQPVSGGVAVCVQQLTRAGVEAGHRVTVVCPSAQFGPLADWVKDSSADHHELNLRRSISLMDVLGVMKLRQLARGYDVIHLHSSKAGALGRLAARSLGRHRPRVIFTPHAWSWLVNSPVSALYRWIERVLAKWADAIVCVSDGERALGAAVIGAEDRMLVIRNGVDLQKYSPRGPAPARSQGLLIVCAGRLSRQKGQDVAIRALAALDHSEAVLRLVGEGPEQESLAELASRLGVADRIEWIGYTEDVASQFRAADVVVAPSRWEGLSLVLLEAMASGAAIVASNVSGSEVLEGAGIIVTPDDHQELARALDRLIADESLRRRLGERARVRSTRFSLDVTLQRNLALWRELGERSARRITAKRSDDQRQQ